MSWLKSIVAWVKDCAEPFETTLTTQWHCWKSKPHEIITRPEKGETTREMVCRHYAKVKAKKAELNRDRPHDWKES